MPDKLPLMALLLRLHFGSGSKGLFKMALAYRGRAA
jgi:hypothetical protein